MKVIVFTMKSETDESYVEFNCEADNIKLSTIELFAPDIFNNPDEEWPPFLSLENSMADRGYYIESSSKFIRYCEMFGLESEVIEY